MRYFKTLLLLPILTLAFAGAGLGLSQNTVRAADLLDDVCDQVTGTKPSTCTTDGTDPLTGKDKDGIIIKAANVVVLITGIAAVIGIIIGGFKYVFSSGDANSIQSAKNTIMYSVIGLAVALLARFIVQYVILNLL